MRHLFIITFLWCAGLGALKAQRMTPFIKALEYYENSSDIKFSYDPAIFSQIDQQFDINKNFTEFITDAQSGLPVEIQKIGDNYYTLSVTLSEYKLSLTDSLASTAIAPPFFFLINSNPTDVKIEGEQVSFLYKPKMADTLIVYAPGYEKKLLPVQYLLNHTSLDIQLMTQTYLLNDVLIEDYITKGINMDPENQKIMIDVKDLPLLPGETDGDIFASLAALPGITTPDGRPGNLFIRGNSVDQSLVLFDNIPIYHRGHYYGTISPYNPKIVDQVEVYRSGYHPRLGGRVGGAVLINSDLEVSNKPQYGVGANTLYGMFYGKTPLANNKIGLTLGARHSYPAAVSSPKLKAISESVFAGTGLVDQEGNVTADVEVIFQDYHAKLIFHPSTKTSVSISGIYSNTSLDTRQSTSPTLEHLENFNFENYGGNMEVSYQLNSHWKASFINTLSNYSYTNIFGDNSADLYAINELKDYNSRLELSKTGSPTHAIQTGLDYKWQSTMMDYNNSPREGAAPVRATTEVSAHTLSPYANFEWFGTDKLYVQLGLRGTYYSPKSTFDWSPRISANYAATSWMNIKGTAGAYYQYLSQLKNLEFGSGGFDNEVWLLASESDGSVMSGKQFMAGTMFHDNQWLLDVEGFFKTADNILYYENRRFDNTSTYFTGDDQIYGVDTYLKRQIGESTSAWVGYSYTNSKVQLDTTDQISYKSKYVQPHMVYVGTAYQKDRWKFSALWKYGSGLNAKSLDIIYAEVIYLRAQNRPGQPPRPNPFADVPERYPSIHSLDLSASYKIPPTDSRKWSASFGLSIINVFDTKNLTDRVFRQQFVDRYALGFAPNLMVLFEW